jgi:hypothetical protein
MTMLYSALVALGWTLWATAIMTNIGKFSKTLSAVFRRAPMLDLLVAGTTWIPWIVLGVMAENLADAPWWAGAVGALAGQVVGLQLWCWGHELANREKVKGPRIVRYLNRRVGRVRNHAALWITTLAYPIFWAIRFGEILVYPLLVWTIRLPKYKQAEWVNVSRTKFDGLVGHDLIWCLYCDWMTGVYSLGAEMLRNIESFWCPIRFYDGKKCENCVIDFPDLKDKWVPANGTMGDVVKVMGEHFDGGDHSWYGHPGRAAAQKVGLTVEGKPPTS